MRDKRTALPDFRRLLREISLLLGYEVTRHLALKQIEIETHVARTSAPVLARPEPCLITILRAGNGLLDGMLDLIPAASVGRSEEHTSELQSLMRNSYAVFRLKKK